MGDEGRIPAYFDEPEDKFESGTLKRLTNRSEALETIIYGTGGAALGGTASSGWHFLVNPINDPMEILAAGVITLVPAAISGVIGYSREWNRSYDTEKEYGTEQIAKRRRPF